MQQDEDGFALAPQVPGQLMAQTYTRFDTMAQFVTAPQQLEMYDVLMLLARVRLHHRLWPECLSHHHIALKYAVLRNFISLRPHALPGTVVGQFVHVFLHG